MIFNTLRVDGYRLLGEFTYEFPESGLWIVLGQNLDMATTQSNGSGKSTIQDAIFFVLFGKSMAGVKVSKYVNQPLGRCMVELTCTVDDVQYVIRRSRKHPVHGTGLEVLADSKALDLHRTRDQDKLVRDLVPFTEDQFRATVTVDHQYYRIFSETSGPQRRRILADLFDIPDLTRLPNALRSSLSSSKSELDRALGSHTVLENNPPRRPEWPEDVPEDWEEVRTFLQTTLEQVQEGIEPVRAKVAHYEQRIRDHRGRDRSLLTQYRLLEDDGEPVKCSSCGTILKPGQDRSEHLQELTSQRQTIQNEINADTAILEHHQRQLKEVSAPVSSLQASLRGTASHEALVRSYQQRLKAYEASVATYDQRLQELTDKIGELQHSVDHLNAAHSLVKSGALDKGYSDYYVRNLNVTLASLSADILGGDYVVLLVVDDKGGVSIDVEGTDLGYKSLSAGEREVIDFIVYYALLMVRGLTEVPCVMLDEIFHFADRSRLQRIIDFLHDAATHRPIYLITHNDYLKAVSPDVITIVREQGVSTIA